MVKISDSYFVYSFYLIQNTFRRLFNRKYFSITLFNSLMSDSIVASVLKIELLIYQWQAKISAPYDLKIVQSSCGNTKWILKVWSEAEGRISIWMDISMRSRRHIKSTGSLHLVCFFKKQHGIRPLNKYIILGLRAHLQVASKIQNNSSPNVLYLL